MKIIFKLFLITLFTSLLFSGCRMLPPADKPFHADEYLHPAEKAGAVEFVKIEVQTASPAETICPAPPIVTEESPKATAIDRTLKLRTSYSVSEGELLSSIAKRPDIYGDPLLWPLLYQANRDQIKDPRKIYTGQVLTVPRNISDEEYEKARNLAKKSDIFSPE